MRRAAAAVVAAAALSQFEVVAVYDPIVDHLRDLATGTRVDQFFTALALADLKAEVELPAFRDTYVWPLLCIADIVKSVFKPENKRTQANSQHREWGVDILLITTSNWTSSVIN